MIGRTVGHYRILERLGGGGMGIVYKAEDLTLDRTVALKFLPPDLTRDEDAKKRFLIEARAAAKLDHPNICNVYDVAESDDGQTFIAMAYYEGESLAKRLERGALPIDEAAKIAVEVARGLGKAHQAGIIHRDIKPANVMLTSDGGVKIVDFGVAKLAGVTMTHGGGSPGTLAYMAPEQIRGEPVTPATDLWALGAVLYEMLTGSRPFRGDYEQAVVYTILNEAPAPIDQTLPNRSPALDAVLEKALTKDPAKRFQTGEGFIAGLETVTRERVTNSPVRKRSVRQVTLAAALLVTIVVAVASWIRSTNVADSKRPSVEGLAVAPVTSSTQVTALDPAQVVIAPFDNRTGDASLDLFGRMAADWITDELTRIDLRVLSQQYMLAVTKAVRSRGTTDDDLGILLAEATGSGLLVTGEYYLTGSTLTIRTKIVDVASRKVLDVLEPVEGTRADLNEVIALAGRQIRDALAFRLLGRGSVISEPIMNRAPLYEAYAEFILCLEAKSRVGGPDYRQALVHAKRAVELDPDYVDAYVYLSMLHRYLMEMREAKDALREAEKRRGTLSPAGRLAVDWWRAALYGEWDRALVISREFERRMPGDYRAQMNLMNSLLNTGRARETLQVLERNSRWLFRNAPDSEVRTHLFRSMTQALAIMGDHQRELIEARNCRRELPDIVLCRAMEARALVSLGRLDELNLLVSEELEQTGGTSSTGYVAAAAARALRVSGRRRESDAMLTAAISTILELPPETQPDFRPTLARLLYEAGRWDEAEPIYATLVKEHAGKPREKVYLGQLGAVVAARGDRARASKISDDLMRMHDADNLGQVKYERAKIVAHLGDKGAAVELLKRAASEGWTGWPSFTQISLLETYAFEPLRGYPPFEEMLKSKD